MRAFKLFREMKFYFRLPKISQKTCTLHRYCQIKAGGFAPRLHLLCDTQAIHHNTYHFKQEATLSLRSCKSNKAFVTSNFVLKIWLYAVKLSITSESSFLLFITRSDLELLVNCWLCISYTVLSSRSVKSSAEKQYCNY